MLLNLGNVQSQVHGVTAVIMNAGNAGIGVETVRLLCKAGFTVILASRNTERGKLVRKELEDEEGRLQSEAKL